VENKQGAEVSQNEKGKENDLEKLWKEWTNTNKKKTSTQRR